MRMNSGANSMMAWLAGGALACICIAGAPAATLGVEITDHAGKPLDDAVIYLLPVGVKAKLKSPGTAIIDQVNKEFVPTVSVIQTGTSVRFPNKDNIRHQIYSFSPVKPFQVKLYSGEPSAPVVFDKPGIVTLGCNIHDHMVAYVVVVDTSLRTITGGDGRARIDDVPPGEYAVHYWHYRQPDRQVPASATLSITGDQTFKASIAVEPRS